MMSSDENAGAAGPRLRILRYLVAAVALGAIAGAAGLAAVLSVVVVVAVMLAFTGRPFGQWLRHRRNH